MMDNFLEIMLRVVLIFMVGYVFTLITSEFPQGGAVGVLLVVTAMFFSYWGKDKC